MRYRFPSGTIDVRRAWTASEVRDAVRSLLATQPLPEARSARIVIKPNLNNDLVALTGNSSDLRVLCSLIETLRDLGYSDLTVADGSNVGVERRRIDVFKRLRVRALERRYGVRLVDLNADDGRTFPMASGAEPKLASTLLDADFRISVPTVKTHAEMGLSVACKNWVGITVAQDKRQIHFNLARNIVHLMQIAPPDLILVDGVIGMEGNGPGDGDPFALGVMLAGTNPWLMDLTVARLLDCPWRNVPYLAQGALSGAFEADLAAEVEGAVEVLRPIRPAPARSRLAIWSEKRALVWLKKAVRPIVSRPRVTRLAYRAKVVQDVYEPKDDDARVIGRDAEACGTCERCADYCPTHLKTEEIGVKTDFEDCINCLYCWWVCPKDAIVLSGELHALERHREKYGQAIQALEAP